MRSISRVLHARALALAAVLVVAMGALASSGPIAAAEGNRPALALGDSVVFGYITQAGYTYVNPHNFVGFPEHYAPDLRLEVTNVSCPGETSGSLISILNPDSGCQAFRSFAPLHVRYTGSELDYATSFLRRHHDTRLVSLLVGANDAFLLQKHCANDPACIQGGMKALLFNLGQNLDATFAALHRAGFRGALVVGNYYSLNYNDPSGTGLVQLLNNTIRQRTLAAGGVIADDFTAFRSAAATPLAAGDSCKAGLLNATPDPARQFTCDVHPSQSGQEVLARAFEDAFLSARDRDGG